MVFLDDDFFPAPTYLERAGALLEAHPEIAVATGVLLADGIHGRGFSPDEGRALLKRPPPAEAGLVMDEYGAYGCNMVVRLAPVFAHGVRFDEQLPLYGWQEDIDFSRQLARYGSVVRAAGLNGVHLGVKGGRTPGVKFGYSQVANPAYLIRQGHAVGFLRSPPGSEKRRVEHCPAPFFPNRRWTASAASRAMPWPSTISCACVSTPPASWRSNEPSLSNSPGSSSELPLVAIVTPVYNGERFLAETMQCVQCSDYPNLLHVALDNAAPIKRHK